MKKCTLSGHFLMQYSVFKLFSIIGNIYICCYIVVCLCDHRCTGNATLQCVCIVELDVTVNSTKILGASQKCCCGEFM